jgi:exopolyphosphatase/guanosine-5'-triphosphate,3'-diphosphate pyrophosphatase
VRIAALDLGSNTIKITVAEVSKGCELNVLGESAEITRIGEKLDENKFLLPQAIERTMAGLGRLVAFARSLGAEKIGCVGTAGLRGASNAQEFLARAKAEHGLEVEIIGGLREAELAFRAPALSYGPGPLIVTDVGGRSTEVVTGSGTGVDQRISFEIGAVRLTERFLKHDPPQAEELAALDTFLVETLRDAPNAAQDAKLIGVSGTVTTLIGLQLDTDEMDDAVRRGEGQALKRERLEEIAAELAQKIAKDRIRGTVLPEGRADVIVAGAHIVLALMTRYQKSEMLASNRGVRYGLLAELSSVKLGGNIEA